MHTYRFLHTAATLLAIVFLALSPLGIAVTHAEDETTNADNAALQTQADQLTKEASYAKNAAEAIFTSIGEILFYVPKKFYIFSAWLFDESLNYTVLNFDDSYSDIGGGVEEVWKALRDLGNILLISVFAYTAFRIILGLDSFGMKSMIARVIIIALLVNFSLLFTKLAIDISNIVAVQVASSFQGGTGDISGMFTQQMGVPKLDDLSAKLTVTYYQQGAGTMFVYVLGIAIFMLISSIVFLYGAGMMIVRFLALVILMMISSLAFLAYATPGGSASFSKWKSNLINYSLFGPVYMLALWAVILVATKLGNGKGLENVLVDPLNSSFASFMQFVIIIGLLFAATKLASKLSVAGASAADTWAGKALGVVSGAGVVGAGARATAGRFGKWASESERMKDWQGRKGMTLGLAQRNIARMALSASEKAAKTSFDLRDSKLAKQLQDIAGVNIGKGVGSYEAQTKQAQKTAEAAAKAFADRTAGAEHKEGIKAAERQEEQAKNMRMQAAENLEGFKRENSTMVDVQKSIQGIEKDIETANKQKQKYEDEKINAERIRNAAAPGSTEYANADTIMREADAKITRLQTEISGHEANLDSVRVSHGPDLVNFESELMQHADAAQRALDIEKAAAEEVKTLKDVQKHAVREAQDDYLENRASKMGIFDGRALNAAKKSLNKSKEDTDREKLAKSIKDATTS